MLNMLNTNRTVLDWVVAPFLRHGHVDYPLLGLFLLINGLVLINAHLHNPEIAYDVYYHMAYVKVLATKFRLPTEIETAEFFSPPLPYLIPAVVRLLLNPSTVVLAKFGQYLNVGLSIFITYGLLRLGLVMNPGSITLRRSTLLLVGMLPVYYKTLAMGVRGEPYVALFVVFTIYMVIRIVTLREQTYWRYDVLGILLGLLILSRQWGFLILPAVFVVMMLLAVFSSHRTRILHCLALTAIIALVSGGWFYIHLKINTGSLTAFSRDHGLPIDYVRYVEEHPDLESYYNENIKHQLKSDWGKEHYQRIGKQENRKIARLSFFHNQDLEFYFGTGNGKLFSKPIRNMFHNQLLPILYSETWGDYWCYFLCVKMIDRTDQELYWDEYDKKISAFLGRVNRVSIIPTVVLLVGFFYGLAKISSFRFTASKYAAVLPTALIAYSVLGSILGYIWFLIGYPQPGKGDSIKASYLLHIFPLLSILGAQILVKIKDHSRFLYRFTFGVLVIVAIHNSPALVTHLDDNIPLKRHWLPDLDIANVYGD